MVLAVLSGALLVVVDGNTNTLIPLFAIGVFIGFTLSQTGLVVHWHKLRPPGWRKRAMVNGFGAIVTAIATVVFLVSKFTEGAWVVVIAIPAFIFLFMRIHAYYQRAGRVLGLDLIPPKPVAKRTIVIVPVNRISRLTEHALSEAVSLGQEVIAVNVVLRTGDDAVHWTESIQHDWRKWDPGVPLRLLRTDYASVVEPIVRFIDGTREENPEDQIVVLIPVIRPDKFRYRLLHDQLDVVLSSALRSREDVIVARVSVPFEPEPDALSGTREGQRRKAAPRGHGQGPWRHRESSRSRSSPAKWEPG